MEMPGGWTMSMMWMRMPGHTWAASFAMFLLMWLTMMVAMMLPSAMPMLKCYHRWFATERQPTASTLFVAAGYFAVWMAVGIGTYLVGATWSWATMHWSSASQLVPALIGAVVLIAGFTQFSRWKLAALQRCRYPLRCASLQPGVGQKSAWRHGLKQGVSCAICCAGPMLALVALGAMDLTIMVIAALVIALEKLMARPEFVVRVSGAAAVVGGVALIFLQILRH
jgi:predicted metal-binding membrane protein